MDTIRIARGHLKKILEETEKPLLSGEFFLDYDTNTLYIGGEDGELLEVSKLKKVDTKELKNQGN